MCSEVEEETLLLLAVCEDEERVRKRRKWVHDINVERERLGEFHTLYNDLLKDEERFYKYFRMTSACFDEILKLIEGDIQKEYTHYRRPISPKERLAVALRFLATGDSYGTIGHSYRVGFSTVSKIVNEVSEAIWRHMQPTYMPEPTREIWEESARGFEELWQFPNCLGSIDGKHITIKCPKNSGSNHFCYLKKFSIVLMAIVDPDYKFMCIDVGGYGKNSDGGIFECSAMGKRFEDGSLNVPPGKPLPGKNEPTPFVIIGDEAFALKPYLMRPFTYRQSRHDRRKEIYNYRLCRARRVVENAFGILAQKWRLFHRPIEVKVESAIKIVKAACVMHNYLRSNKCDQQLMEILEPANSGMGAFDNVRNEGRRATNLAFDIRESFVDCFNM